MLSEGGGFRNGWLTTIDCVETFETQLAPIVSAEPEVQKYFRSHYNGFDKSVNHGECARWFRWIFVVVVWN